MKISISTVRLVTGLSLTASLFIGCQDFLGQKEDGAASTVTTTDDTALRLSIKDDSSCRDQWVATLEARKAGTEDSAWLEDFLKACVKEVKVVKDWPIPVIPPHLLPDSVTRCHWIGGQIKLGRDEMTVNFKRYCADDCRKLDTTDGIRHKIFCLDTTFHPRHDSIVWPPRDSVWPPRDSVWPHHDSIIRPPHDSFWPPHDSIIWPPRDTGSPDTLRDWNPISLDSICIDLKARLAATALGNAERAALEKLAMESCRVHLPPVLECEAIRAKLASLAPLATTSPEYARLNAALAEHCPILPVVP